MQEISRTVGAHSRRKLTEHEVCRIKEIAVQNLSRQPSLTSDELMRLAGISGDQARFCLRQLVEEGKLRQIGRTSGTRYVSSEA